MSDEFVMDPNHDMRAILESRVGKTVFVGLHSGQEIAGRVAVVGLELVQISHVAQRDFYDALIRCDQIASVMVKARS